MRRWLVVFSSHALPPRDATFVDAEAESPLAAIAVALHDAVVPHEWRIAHAAPWPESCGDVQDAASRASGIR